jgi:threonine dehydrogenase-like Zn-dependent dehydrogenase
LVLKESHELQLVEHPPAPLLTGEARLRARLSGISHGTELSLYRGTSAFADRVFDRGLRAFVTPHAGNASAYPVTLGYEMVSKVVEVAPDVTAVEVGDLVHTGTPHQEETVLDVAESLATTYPLVVLPSDERLERALFISLSAVALQAVHDAEVKLGDAVSVHGLGAIGLMAIQMCQLKGIQNVWHRPRPAAARARDEARRHGRAGPGVSRSPWACRSAPQPRRGVDVAIEVSGPTGPAGALSAAGLGATVAASFYQGGAANLRLGEFHHNRLSLIASIGGWGRRTGTHRSGTAGASSTSPRGCSTPTGCRSTGCSPARSRSTSVRSLRPGTTSTRRRP